MAGSVAAYNSTQKIPEKAITGTMTDATPPYTCPAGKKALVSGKFGLVSFGASNIVDLRVNGIAVITWKTVEGTGFTFSQLYYERTIQFQLNAGEAFNGHGNVSENATINYTVRILELPA